MSVARAERTPRTDPTMLGEADQTRQTGPRLLRVADGDSWNQPGQRSGATMYAAFTRALGQPKSVEEFDAQMTSAVRAAMGASASAPMEQVYAAFNAHLTALPADKKMKFFSAAFAASKYLPGEAKFQPLAFFSKIFQIRRLDGNVIPPQDKTAHQFGPGGIVDLTVSENAPSWLNTDRAIVRIAPGARSKAPGFSFIFPGGKDQTNQSRVLMSVTGDYSAPLSTRALGLETDGPEGELKFEASEALRSLPLTDADGKPTEAWMQAIAELPAGTELGTLRSADPSKDWSITVRTGDAPITTNMMADRSLRFPRNVRPSGVAGWAGWSAVAVLLSPVLLIRAAIQAFSAPD